MMNGALLRAAAECWGTGLQFDPLPGEYDLNYMVSGAHDGVLKIMNAGRDRADTDLQVAMLDHLRGDETLLVPGVIKTLSGAATAELPNVGGPPRLPRLISRLPDHLDTCFFVNSGSEANEVALLPTSPLI